MSDSTRNGATAEQGDARKTVLVIDDDVDLLEIVAEILEGEGYAVAKATNGLEALAYLDRAAPPSVILLDLMMPAMDGWSFRSVQKARADLSSIPVIVVSAGGHLGPVAPEIEAEGSLRKPITIDALLGVVDQVVGQRGKAA